ncbi:nitric oxide reductase activation protein NorD [Amycolatopsis sp. FDAARGOS 1241]|uniref:nitric oxide reductase activation protein NorD n=1 Tax=Amycolatopsis sp. FDAARGOS 1241 TaxID=2778070 RepID=UPI0019520CBF|nr:VWA domain-containing protein [Amycolatopsis sp. FDAARGOS 1241]QRP50459.1 VWA domain-containing protein [Amycolatopsis sp. FDAARGOS 1241]
MTAALAQLTGSLSLYYRALCGRGCELVPYDDDGELRQHPDTATTVRLPSHVHSGPSWYRVAVTHRALHHELGTFELALERPEPFFRRLRPASLRGGLDRFAGLFPRTALAVEVFTVLEDLRVDNAALRLFPGLAAAYERVREHELATRPDLAALPARSAAAEALVRLSLGAASVRLPRSLRPNVARLAAVARVLTDPRSTVESTAEAAIRCYGVLARLPNLEPAAGPGQDLSLVDDSSDVDFPVTLPEEEFRLEGDEVFDVRFVPVRYRDVPGPRYLGLQASGMPLAEAILRMTGEETGAADEFTERSLAAESGQVDVTTPARPPDPLPHDHGPDLEDHDHAESGPVHASGRHEFAYPEWDHRAGRYLADWCLVREKRPRSGRSARGHHEALSRNRALLPALTAQLERMAPLGRRRRTRLRHGDDLDLDACVEAMADLRTGRTPREAVYSALEPVAREVAVAFALDLSSSTAERLPERADGVPRILDLERESVALLLEALERVGDSYGIYGFSGTGRADVVLSVVKSLDERRTPATLRRLAGLVPQHTTRMGPAIRHLTRRLAAHDAPSKLLMLLSDGRPFDLDYGQQYGEDAVLDYALADTTRALTEARHAGVRPYLITVDPTGGDYLRTMCDPDEYHVITDPRDLPAALARLYVTARRA